MAAPSVQMDPDLGPMHRYGSWIPSVLLITICVLGAIVPVRAQQVAVQVARLDSAGTGLFRKRTEATHFRKKETIELDFTIAAEIDSISPLAGKGFTVLNGPGKGRSDNWTNGKHTFTEWRYYQIQAKRRGWIEVPSVVVYSGGKEFRSEVLSVKVGR